MCECTTITSWQELYILAPTSQGAKISFLIYLHHLCIDLIIKPSSIVLCTTPTWQWSRDIFGHEELLLLVEKPRPVGVQLGNVDQVQLYWVFFPEHRHSHNHFWSVLCKHHHCKGHCTHIYEWLGRSCWGKYFQKQLQQQFTKSLKTCVSTKLPAKSYRHQPDNHQQRNPMLKWLLNLLSLKF